MILNLSAIYNIKFNRSTTYIVLNTSATYIRRTPAKQPAATNTPSGGGSEPTPDVAAPQVTDTSVASAESTLVTGDEYESQIQEMMAMGFSREMVIQAMRASFNNPTRAVDYLLVSLNLVFYVFLQR